MLDTVENPLHLTSLNHISLVCISVEKSLDFYQNVLGFFPIRRPGSFDFDGAWLFNYGIGIHLLQSENPLGEMTKREINPKDNHISFQCESMTAVERKLKEMGMEYEKRVVEEGGIFVDQLFFHDPDGFMIEICNCDNLPVIPLTGGEPVLMCSRVSNFKKQHQQLQRQATQKQQQQQQQQQTMVQCLPTTTTTTAAVYAKKDDYLSCA
ncbi:uncharacterized protein LOC122071977 [Macadamia integrifolia]|uniref:uncharacterized protein LOC122071977 n=1 Tax=Macadamia integrifolia TaxID=60698 RepID=UPI001C5024C9|nr:uncharacterized protein LOC122071977 [Macadamia integrifolia]